MTIYHDIIMDHFRNPRCFGCSGKYNKMSHKHNPSCGDRIMMKVLLQKEKIVNICFEGHGCALSIASASMLCDYAKNSHVSKLKKLKEKDVLVMLGIDIGPVRNNCVMMAYNAMREALFLGT
jgi:nitrogen fixation protein NifU and related proteins